MITDIGIIEKDKNQFTCQPWVKAGLEFTESVRRFLPPLLGKDERTIREFVSSFQKSRIVLSGFKLDIFT